MRWRDRFLFVAEACYKAQAETGKILPNKKVLKTFFCLQLDELQENQYFFSI
jgi:hypothetical protein